MLGRWTVSFKPVAEWHTHTLALPRFLQIRLGPKSRDSFFRLAPPCELPSRAAFGRKYFSVLFRYHLINNMNIRSFLTPWCLILPKLCLIKLAIGLKTVNHSMNMTQLQKLNTSTLYFNLTFDVISGLKVNKIAFHWTNCPETCKPKPQNANLICSLKIGSAASKIGGEGGAQKTPQPVVLREMPAQVKVSHLPPTAVTRVDAELH